LEKFRGNRRRDTRVVEQLEELGYKVVVVWECEARDGKALERQLRRLKRLNGPR
jgi:DNA mismatch endonuclease (patch repair protein)